MQALESAQYVLRSVATQRAPKELLDVVLALFDGHDIPALWWSSARRRTGYYKAPNINRTLAFEAHLLGAVIAGSYPFRGVSPWCSCPARKHVCDGMGCNYLCIDLDAKNGEQDVNERARRIIAICWRIGLLPVVFSSRSATGLHIYVFLNRPVTTRVAHVAGRVLANAAGVTSRCDIIPSAEHYTGLGTLHALPLSPLAEPGGGVLYETSCLRPVTDPGLVLSLLRWVHDNRSPAGVIEDVAAGRCTFVQSDLAVQQPRVVRRIDREAYAHAPALLTKRDAVILAAMKARHPQFKQALDTDQERWRGKRSSRDAYLVAYMRRQGMTPPGIVRAMLDLPGTKAGSRGEHYVWALVDAHFDQDALRLPSLAGTKLRPAEARKQRQALPWAPWDLRVAPPRRYGTTPSPWWDEPVQAQLKQARSRCDAILLAYLVDRYFRGYVRRRLYFVGRRELGRHLGYPSRTLGRAAIRLARRFPQVIRMVSGVPHPTLRVANGYYVPESSHRDRVDWYLAPARAGRC